MALSAQILREHMNNVPETDEFLARLLNAAIAHFKRELGFAIDDAVQYPEGTPEDIEHGVLMLAAHWYENREATLVGVAAQPVPFGVVDVIRNHRGYSYG
jgi:hypothetical protein